jgi:hypothetical protein
LGTPWSVSGSHFDAAARRLDIEITFAKGARFACPRAIRFSENVVADIGEWTSTYGRRTLDFGGRVGYHDCNQI